MSTGVRSNKRRRKQIQPTTQGYTHVASTCDTQTRATCGGQQVPRAAISPAGWLTLAALAHFMFSDLVRASSSKFMVVRRTMRYSTVPAYLEKIRHAKNM